MATYLNKIKILDSSGEVSKDSPFGLGIGTLREESGNIVYGPEGDNAITLIKYDANSDTYTLMINETPLQEYIDSNEKFLSEIKLSDDGKKLIFTWNIDIDGEEGPKTKTIEIDITTLLETRSYVIEDPSKIDDVEAIEAAVTSPIVGDIAIVIRTLVSDKKTRTAYVYNSEKKWEALDGNYNADNVYLSTNLVMTANIGAQQLDQGQSNKILATEGKNIKQVLSMLLAQEKAPAIESNPAVTTKIGNNAEPANSNITVEGGSTITPKWSASLSAGSYTYGPSTKITAKSWRVTDNSKDINSEWKNNTSEASSGAFDSLVLPAGKTYQITATAKYDAAPLAHTNLGEEYKEGNALFDATAGAKPVQIGGGEKSDASPSITAWQQGYYIGTLESKDTKVTSNILRNIDEGKGLLKNRYVKNGNYAPQTLKFENDTAFEGTMAKFVVAYPSSIDKNDTAKGLTKFFNNSSFEEYVTNFSKETVKVAGADSDLESAHAIDYTVCTWAPTSAFSGPIKFEVTLS